jgi:PHD/YefM family antitoxin component YafN of YafNO toxin-antitoxin module
MMRYLDVRYGVRLGVPLAGEGMIMRTDDITSVTQHRDHLRDHLNRLKETRRPMFITNKRGETEAVVLSAEAYDALMDELELARSLATIDRSMEEVKAGRGKDYRQAIRDIAGELGLELKR